MHFLDYNIRETFKLSYLGRYSGIVLGRGRMLAVVSLMLIVEEAVLMVGLIGLQKGPLLTLTIS